jgi:phosphatidylserine/phosphatidylglycerophosphate/cardiolipin synthase-like enzyme
LGDVARGPLALVVAVAACSGTTSAPTSVPPQPLVDPTLRLLVTPAADHRPFVDAIDAATASIDLAMFHLTDETVATALTHAAARGVRVRVLLDRGGIAGGKRGAKSRVVDELQRGGVDVRPSTRAFTITHEKAMVVDGKVAFVTAINLTTDVANTRDLGVVLGAPSVVGDVDALFDADWSNATSNGDATPALHEPALVVSPGARGKLVGLLASARRDVIATVENLGDPVIEDAFADAAARGVGVRVIVPMCDKNPNPTFNYPHAVDLSGRGVKVEMMPAPESPAQPYVHSKMIQVDGGVATFVGSINFSVNSTMHARELGVIFANDAAARAISATFDADWKAAVAPPQAAPSCPAGS